MKKLIFLLIFGIGISCNETKEKNPETNTISEENKKLREEVQNKDSILEEYLNAINEIEDNLNSIKMKERMLTIHSREAENEIEKKDQIIADIQFINELMIKNNEKMAELEKKLKNGNFKSLELEKLIKRMSIQLEEKDGEIKDLQAELLKVNNALEHLFSEYNQRLDELDKQTGRVNTAWYAVGTGKELKENGVITKEGGFIGLGKSTKLNNDFNKDYFTRIDITETPRLELYGKNAKILTNHPATSYKIEKTEQKESVVILDSENFWGVSKYLVVLIE